MEIGAWRVRRCVQGGGVDGKRGFRRGSSYILHNVGGADTGQLEGEGRYTGIRCPLAVPPAPVVPPACPTPPDRPASLPHRSLGGNY